MSFDDYDIPPIKSWEKFQQMVCELFREIWQDPHAQEFGSKGQKQDGIDILGRRKGHKKYEAVQVTKETPLTKNKIKKDYEASYNLDFELDCFIVATSSKRDASIQEYAATLSQNGPYRCVIWFWQDIVKKLAEHKKIHKKYYPNDIFIKAVGVSAGKIVEVNDDTTRWVLHISKISSTTRHYGGLLLISDLLSYNCQTYRLGDHWERLVLADYIKPEFQRCVGGNKYGAFLVSNWLNSFKSVEELFSAEKERFVFKLTPEKKHAFHTMMKELREEYEEDEKTNG